MCDTADDMDEFIEYELARDCIEIDNDDGCDETIDNVGLQDDGDVEFLYSHEDEDCYEILEELEDEDDKKLVNEQILVDIKPEILEPKTEDQDTDTKFDFKSELLDQDILHEDHLIDEDYENEENGYINEDEVEEIEYEEILNEDEETEEESESVIPDTQPPPTKKLKLDKAIDIEIEREKKVNKKDTKNEETIKKVFNTPADIAKVGPDGAIRRYMLFDDLVACIVDYDPDGTPIVEFSISNCEADEKLPMECGICPDVMTRAQIPAHLKTHLVPGTTNRYQCIYCEETYKDCKYLAGHARRHMGIRPYVCELCKLYFSTKQDLRVHNQRRHQEKDHICEVCGKTFAQNTQLKRHREATHEKKRRFQCEHCPKSYYKNFSLQEHIRAVHMGKRRMIVCPFCGMQCRDAHKMARHRKQMHLHQSHYECQICNEEFTDINYFDAHKRSIQCRNNTRRKLEEEGLQQQQQQQQLEEQIDQLQPEQLIQIQQKLKVLVEDADNNDQLNEDTSHQQFTQNSIGILNQQQQELHHLISNTDDEDQLQIIEEDDIKHLIATAHHDDDGDETAGQFILSNDLLQHHKVEILTSDDVADDEELVYEITIDSNE